MLSNPASFQLIQMQFYWKIEDPLRPTDFMTTTSQTLIKFVVCTKTLLQTFISLVYLFKLNNKFCFWEKQNTVFLHNDGCGFL